MRHFLASVDAALAQWSWPQIGLVVGGLALVALVIVVVRSIVDVNAELNKDQQR